MVMDDKTQNKKDLFTDLGLSLEYRDVEVGQLYPIYGAITKFISDEPGNIVVMINDQIEATLNVIDDDKIGVLKQRTFDSGIFLCTITEKGLTIKADCTTVIFGKSNDTVQ